MGRRKKEPEATHRENMAFAAERLFSQKGIEAVTMDDIAREAGYSKATLYVYFTSKDEMVVFLVLNSMKLLYDCISRAVSGDEAVKVKYQRICHALVEYQQQYPLYFSFALGEINVDLEGKDCLPVERETFEVGELISGEVMELIREGIRSGEFRQGLHLGQTVFLLWAALSGLIQMAANKKDYLDKNMKVSQQQFLEFGFESLYEMIAAKEEGK